MLKTTGFRRGRGFVLLEALIALLIFALGLAAYLSFQSGMMREDGLVKARNEALNLAEAKLEELRNNMRQPMFEGLADGSESITGNNAAFTVAWNVGTATDPDYRVVQVNVAWTDAAGDTQTASVSSLVSWMDPRKVAAVAGHLSDPNSKSKERLIPEPTGGRRYPGTTYTEDEYDDLIEGGDAVEMGDDYTVHFRDDHSIELIDSVGDDAGNHVVIIQFDGDFVVLIHGEVRGGENVSLEAEIETLTSAEGECVYPEATNFLASNDPTKTYYHCYVGQFWFGNVTVIGHDRKTRRACPPLYKWRYPIGSDPYLELVSSVNGGATVLPANAVKTLPGQDFDIYEAKHNETCEDLGDTTSGNNLTITGKIYLDDSLEQLHSATVVEASNGSCEIGVRELGASGNYRYSYTCTVPGPEWQGYVAVIPEEAIEICGVNAWRPDNPLIAPGSHDFSVTARNPATTCEQGEEYLYTINISVDTSGGAKESDIAWTTTPSLLGPCYYEEAAKGGDPSWYHCSLLAEAGVVASLNGTLSGAGVLRVGGSLLPITVPLAPLDGDMVSDDFLELLEAVISKN